MGYRTSRIVIRSGGKHRTFYQITRENMRHAKAVYNTTLFHIRNLYTGLNKDEGERTKNENEVIARVCAAIADVNSKRILKGEAPYSERNGLKISSVCGLRIGTVRSLRVSA